MQKPIDQLLSFQGQWRAYQKRVLDRADSYLKDKRIHIVAAPGSGKTTLGIELIRRLNAPALILSPSINIRNQWIERVREAYLPAGTDTTGILSSSIRESALITAITYQALHSCMTGKSKAAAAEFPENESPAANSPEKTAAFLYETEKVPSADEETEDYSGFDFFAAVKNAGIRTICLDEAHHLRSEWWKALEELVDKIPGLTIISLTATPPYDSTENEWNRYISLCGPIDEEIIVPELVKENSLCPHQDYIYFNVPTEEERQAVSTFRSDAAAVGEQIYMDSQFTALISSHVGIKNPGLHAEELLTDPEYFSSILVFLHSKGIPVSKELLAMMGNSKTLPQISLRWLEILLQGFLYEDTASYSSDEAYREQMIELLKSHGLIQRNKVSLTVNDSVNKLLINSKGKINSIVSIVKQESQSLGSDLRLLILTDYIKKEYLTALGNEEKSVNELGVVPIFENIRRSFSKDQKNPDLRLAALSGSVVLIPASAKNTLEELLSQSGTKGTMKECGADGYYQVTVSGTGETASGLVTELFNRGEIQVLIGTKSLLGEGWDSPCINSLILASFVGSFMLSNQMRGRAIRTMKGNPGKISNIWHLICMEPELQNAGAGAFEPELQNPEAGSLAPALQNVGSNGARPGKQPDGTKATRTLPSASHAKTGKNGTCAAIPGGLEIPAESEDFATLKRRFESFLGVHYEKNVIENGLERLSVITPPYDTESLMKINQKTLAMAADRPALGKRWKDSLAPLTNMEVAVEVGVAEAYLKPGSKFSAAVIRAILYVLLLLLSAGLSFGVSRLFFLPAAFFLFRTCKYAAIAYSMATPRRFLQSIGKGILHALHEYGSITSKQVSVDTDEGDGSLYFIYLKGGTEREKDVFAQCILEMFGAVENQRYLLRARKKAPTSCKYYCVPELFGKKKEDAARFANAVSKYIGAYEPIYTKNGNGRKILLEARVHSLANKSGRCVAKKKRVKNA